MARNLYFILLSALCLVLRFFVMQLLLYSLTRYKTYVKSQFYQTDGRYSWERITKENVKLMHLFTQLFRLNLYFKLSVFSIRVPGCNSSDIFLISDGNRKNSHTQVTGELRSSKNC